MTPVEIFDGHVTSAWSHQNPGARRRSHCEASPH
jgi:hypothetical protein